MKRLDRPPISIYNSVPFRKIAFAEVVELVDTSVSKTDCFWQCRFDSGLRHQ